MARKRKKGRPRNGSEVPMNTEPYDNGCQGKCQTAIRSIADDCTTGLCRLKRAKEAALAAVQVLQESANHAE